MKIRMSYAACAAFVIGAVAAQPAFAQTGKNIVADNATAKTYKRKLYTGKDAEKYRAMNDIQYTDRKNRSKGDHGDESHSEERRYTEGHGRQDVRKAAPTNEEDNVDRAERREARPITPEVGTAEKPEQRERNERPAEASQEENREHGSANDSRHGYRKEVRGSRKEMRRKSREEKWTRQSDDAHADKQ